MSKKSNARAGQAAAVPQISLFFQCPVEKIQPDQISIKSSPTFDTVIDD
jgi:hypothetical protein